MTAVSSGLVAGDSGTVDRDWLSLELDPEREAARKAHRARHLNTIEIPRLRAFGCSLLIVGALLHNRLLLGQFSWHAALTIAGILSGYAIGSWLALSLLWERVRAFDLAAFFLVLDVFVWASIIYLTGGTQSWLFFITLARVADQTPIAFSRALFFAHLAPAGYAGVVLTDSLQGLPVSWMAEACKILFIYITAVYIAFVARTAERRQRRRAAVIRLAKQLIRDLADRSGQLAEAKLQAEAALDRQASLAREKLALYERTRQQQVQLTRVFDSTSDGIIFVGRDGRIESANVRAGELLGFDPAAVAGTGIVELFGSSLGPIGTTQPWRDTLQALLTSPELGRQGDLQHPATKRVLQWAAVPTRDEFGTTLGLTFTLQDVTRNRDLIRQLGYKSVQLEDANRHMEAANRAKEEFLAYISHEIRTPLSAIVGMTQLALEVQVPADRQRYLEKLKGSADALLAVINDILDFSRIEAGRIDLDVAPFSLHDVILAVVDTVRVQAERKRLDLSYQISRDVPDRLVGDAERLRQTLLNLMANAVKFTDRGEVALAVDVVSRSPGHVVLHLAVKDTGVGIPPEKHQGVFAAFTQADGTTTRRYGGTGLGLAIASRLAKLMCGDIRLESEPGRGSTFHLTVRFALPAAQVTAPAPPRPVSRPDVSRRRVLVADDDAVHREVISDLLERAGHAVVAVASGPAAVEASQRGRFDVVLLDLQIPEMGGFETAVAIRRLEPPGFRTSIVALTASDAPGYGDRCRDAGIDASLSKPVSRDNLVAVVEGSPRLP